MGGIFLATLGGSALFCVVAAFSLTSTAFQWAGQRAYLKQSGKALDAARVQA
jgi:hypothetical protein